MRTIVFNYLSDPDSSLHDESEIFDLLEFYGDEKMKNPVLITDCDVAGTKSHKKISKIMEKTIVFEKECNDGVDNDRDGLRDEDDIGCWANPLDPDSYDSDDTDETNCGDGTCEASSESCSSCSVDCTTGCGPLPVTILTMKSASGNAISFNDYGDIILKGTLQQDAINPLPTTDDEFIFKDISGNPAAIVNLMTGNMIITGSLYRSQDSLSLSIGGDFIVKKNDGSIVSYIDNSGNLYLKGFLIENGNP